MRGLAYGIQFSQPCLSCFGSSTNGILPIEMWGGDAERFFVVALRHESNGTVMNCTEIDLNAVIASQALPRLLGDGVSLRVEASPEPAEVHAHEGMMGQILTALVEQARQSLPGGGEILLQTEHVEVDDIHARIQPGARCGEFVRLTVRDNGSGFRTEQLRKMFTEIPEPTTARSGTALPLPLIAGIVKRRHGWIEASSQSGGGTTVQVYFPAATPVSAAGLTAPWVSETILLVDDEVAIRRMVKSVLLRASYEVVEADTGVQALAIWEEHKERVNLLLTDMVMPDGLTGRDLAQQLLAGKPELKVIYTSGFDLDAEAHRDTVRGAIRFLHKPYDMRRLLETVHAAMATTSGVVHSAPTNFAA
jgi:CheY-like chemotaxis protein